MSKPDVAQVKAFLLQLQDEICRGLEQADGAGRFEEDMWRREGGGGGRTRVLRHGAVIEQGRQPPTFTVTPCRRRPRHTAPNWPAAGSKAMGVSLVIHPHNPMCRPAMPMSASSSQRKRARNPSGGLAAVSI